MATRSMRLKLTSQAERLVKEVEKKYGLNEREIVARALKLLEMAHAGRLAEIKGGQIVAILKI